MKKITELKEKRFKTVTKKDIAGKRVRTQEEFIGLRPVRTVATGPRFGHFVIDMICFRIIIFTVQFLFSFLLALTKEDLLASSTFILLAGVGTLLLYPLIYFICENTWQKTPGKFLTKCIVINEYGEKPDARTLILRSLLRLVPFEGFSCLGGESSYGWHDKWSNTWVVKNEELELIKKLQEEQSNDSKSI